MEHNGLLFYVYSWLLASEIDVAGACYSGQDGGAGYC